MRRQGWLQMRTPENTLYVIAFAKIVFLTDCIILSQYNSSLSELVFGCKVLWLVVIVGRILLEGRQHVLQRSWWF